MPLLPLEDRLANAEAVLAQLTRELSAIRAELGGVKSTEQPLRSRAAGYPPRRPTEPARESRSFDLERLLGRYGMLGIAVLAAVAAVGTFLNWAIKQGYLTIGPAARVLLGIAFAAAIATWGFRLRRGERSFGSSIVGLALVIILVCAYAAGPGFHLVPAAATFAGCALLTWGLGVFARSEDDEPLWCVAFGGAAIAPFVTSSGGANIHVLLSYALVTLLAACFGISQRAWPVAWRVFYAACALFVLTAAWMTDPGDPLAICATFALPLAVGAAGIVPFAPASRKRAALRWLAVLALAVTSVLNEHTMPWAMAGAIVVAVALWLLIVDRLGGVAQSSLLARNAPPEGAQVLHWIDSAVIPVLFALRAEALVAAGWPAALVDGTVATMILSMLWRHPVGAQRDASAVAFMFGAATAFAELSPPTLLAHVTGIVVLALAALWLHRLRPSRGWIAAGVALLAAAAVMTVQAQMERTIYMFKPFATAPALAAVLVTTALIIVSRAWRSLLEATCESMGQRARRTYAGGLRALLESAVAAPWIWTFVWVLVELSMAHSASVSTLLLVTYFAATAVASVAAGRARRSALLRRLGLALALAAAATSVYGASTYFGIGVRIIAYLVTSTFLLGIAFWYRRSATTEASASTASALSPP